MNISRAQPASLTNYDITLLGSFPTPTTHRQVRQSCKTGEGPVEKREEQAGRQKSFPLVWC
jgi:hypothetical protein